MTGKKQGLFYTVPVTKWDIQKGHGNCDCTRKLRHKHSRYWVDYSTLTYMHSILYHLEYMLSCWIYRCFLASKNLVATIFPGDAEGMVRTYEQCSFGHNHALRYVRPSAVSMLFNHPWVVYTYICLHAHTANVPSWEIVQNRLSDVSGQVQSDAKQSRCDLLQIPPWRKKGSDMYISVRTSTCFAWIRGRLDCMQNSWSNMFTTCTITWTTNSRSHRKCLSY